MSMLLGLVKWSYRRGVLHERLRVRRIFAEFSRRTDEQLKLLYQRAQDDPAISLTNELQKEIAIKAEALRLVNSLLDPNEGNTK
jgi:hypothetical protein